MTRGQLTTVPQMLDFMLGGNATLTVESRSGKHYTYKVKRAKDRDDGPAHAPLRWFVNLLSGPDNTGDFTYIGLLEQRDGYRLNFRLTSASRLGKNTAPVAGFAWLVRNIVDENEKKLGQARVFHEGRCSRCNRKLTDPVSISTGIGPVCAGREE